MLKLLRADFFCLRRSRPFWVCAAAAFVLSSVYMLRADGDGMQTLEQNLLQVFPFLPILHAAFVSLFLGLEYQDGTLLLSAAVILLLTAAVAAILTMLCMLLTNRAVSAVTAILLMFGLLALASVFYNALCEPEMAAAAIMTVNGFEVGEPTPNPDYVSGALRTVYQFAVDALPTGQAILLANQELEHPAVSLSASAGLVLLCTAVDSATGDYHG